METYGLQLWLQLHKCFIFLEEALPFLAYLHKTGHRTHNRNFKTEHLGQVVNTFMSPIYCQTMSLLLRAHTLLMTSAKFILLDSSLAARLSIAATCNCIVLWLWSWLRSFLQKLMASVRAVQKVSFHRCRLCDASISQSIILGSENAFSVSWISNLFYNIIKSNGKVSPSAQRWEQRERTEVGKIFLLKYLYRSVCLPSARWAVPSLSLPLAGFLMILHFRVRAPLAVPPVGPPGAGRESRGCWLVEMSCGGMWWPGCCSPGRVCRKWARPVESKDCMVPRVMLKMVRLGCMVGLSIRILYQREIYPHHLSHLNLYNHNSQNTNTINAIVSSITTAIGRTITSIHCPQLRICPSNRKGQWDGCGLCRPYYYIQHVQHRMNPNWSSNSQHQPKHDSIWPSQPKTTGWQSWNEQPQPVTLQSGGLNPGFSVAPSIPTSVQGGAWGQDIPAAYHTQNQGGATGWFVMPGDGQQQIPNPNYPNYSAGYNANVAVNSSYNFSSNNGWGEPTSQSWGTAAGKSQNDVYQQPQSVPGNQQQAKQQGTAYGIDLGKDVSITTALDSGMSVDVSKNQNTKGQLLLWKKSGEPNQRFRLVRVGDRFRFECVDSGYALETDKNSSAKGALIVAAPQTGSPNQLFQLVEVKPNSPEEGFFIRTFSGKCWDLCEWKTAQNTPIMQYDFNGGKNQIWHIKNY